MKYLYTIAIALLGYCTAAAQNTTYLPGESGNNCSLSIEFDEAEILEEASFTLSMTNPGIDICVLSAYFYFDDNQVRPWAYDPDVDTYDVETNDYDKRKNPNGRVTDQSLQVQLSNDDNLEHPGYFYVAIAGAKNFLREEGEIATIYFDATKLSEGDHVLHMKDALCGSITGEGTDLQSVTYLCADQDIHFNVRGNTITIIDGINNIFPLNPKERVYDLGGRTTLPSQHGIYIINGKKIIK